MTRASGSVVRHARSTTRTAAGMAAATPCSGSESRPIRGKALGKRRECPRDRQSPRYPTLTPSWHVREIRARGRGAGARDVLQRRPERPPSAEATKHRGQTLAAAQRDVGQHVTSTSLSSSTFGLANTANPTLRRASTQGRTTSALPGAMLVNTVASGSGDVRAVGRKFGGAGAASGPARRSGAGAPRWAGHPGSSRDPCPGWARPRPAAPVWRGGIAGAMSGRADGSGGRRYRLLL